MSEVKLANHLQCINLGLASAATVTRVTGAEVGYAGPVGLPDSVQVIWDLTTKGRVNIECGGNKTHYHNINVNFGTDVSNPKEFIDIREVKAGETCIKCQKGKLIEKRGIELGHIFKLGSIYSKAMDATFTDQDGSKKPIIMGCYGIGMSRSIAAIVESFHDDKGIIWPSAVAPYRVHLISLPGGEAMAESVYKTLNEQDIDVLWDDRDVSAGVKFGDADLIGIPTRLLVSSKTGDKIEIKQRNETTTALLALDEIIRSLKAWP